HKAAHADAQRPGERYAVSNRAGKTHLGLERDEIYVLAQKQLKDPLRRVIHNRELELEAFVEVTQTVQHRVDLLLQAVWKLGVIDEGAELAQVEGVATWNETGDGLEIQIVDVPNCGQRSQIAVLAQVKTAVWNVKVFVGTELG